jgi:hypothetical protein
MHAASPLAGDVFLRLLACVASAKSSTPSLSHLGSPEALFLLEKRPTVFGTGAITSEQALAIKATRLAERHSRFASRETPFGVNPFSFGSR